MVEHLPLHPKGQEFEPRRSCWHKGSRLGALTFTGGERIAINRKILNLLNDTPVKSGGRLSIDDLLIKVAYFI